MAISDPRGEGDTIDDESLIDAIRDLADGGTPPTAAEMVRQGEYSLSTYQSRFGGWNAAIEAAGYEPNHDHPGELTKTELLRELRRLGEELGEMPTSRQMDRLGRHSKTTYQNNFGSWMAALEKAAFNLDTGDVVSEKTIIDDLQRVNAEVEGRLTAKVLHHQGEFDAVTYIHLIGNGSLRQALRRTNTEII